MASHNEMLLSMNDAELLASLHDDSIPADRIGMNCLVHYVEEPGGLRRKVALVHPSEAAPSEGRISVLSPVGRALLGRKSGATAAISVPGGRALTLRVLAVDGITRAEAA